MAGWKEAEALKTGGFSGLDKGISIGFEFAPGASVLEGALLFPLMLLKESALAHNLEAMARWCAANGFLLSPHGKTTMTPRLFERQLGAGAWAITVATASQAAVCAAMGLPRILIANQIVGRANLRSLAAMMRENPGLEILCLVDSVEGIEFLGAEWREARAVRPLGVFVEVGNRGWRTGARSVPDALRLCSEVGKHAESLILRGIEGFEGLAHAEDSAQEGRMAREFLSAIAEAGEAFAGSPAAPGDAREPLLLSAGGSAFLDAVWEFGRRMQPRFRILLRSGCYITHDHGQYARKNIAAHQRADSRAELPEFRPALELWSHVQSRPEEGLAILNFGKRDCPYDAGLPIPLYALGASGRRVDLRQAAVAATNDQHAYLKGPGLDALRIGDAVCCGISHPCTAFDKWRVLPVVDDDYRLLEIYRTFF